MVFQISALTKALAGGGAADASKFSSTAVQHQGIGQAAVGGANSIADTFLKATDEKTNRSEGVGVGDQDPTLLFSRSGSDPSSKQDNTNPYSNNNNTLASVTLGAAAAAAPFSNGFILLTILFNFFFIVY